LSGLLHPILYHVDVIAIQRVFESIETPR